MSVNEVKIKKAEVAFELRGTGPPTSRTFVLGDEDHTLGNALRHILVNDARVDFAGYCVPHPSEPVVHLRVQTRENVGNAGSGGGGGGKTSTGSGVAGSGGGEEDEVVMEGSNSNTPLTAIEALKEACTTLSDQCDFVLQQLEVAMPEVGQDRERMARLAEADMMEEEEDGMGDEEGEDFMEDEE